MVSRRDYWQNSKRTPLLAILSFAIGLAGVFIVAEIVLRFLPVPDGLLALPVNSDNPLLRWTPNRRFTYSKGWNFALVNHGRINNYGFVNDQEYDASLHAPLLAVVGDSYVEALMVPYNETLHGRLARLVSNRGRVYSFGMSGAALSQYLAEADFARATFRPQGLVIVIVGNDFDESLRPYKLQRSHHYFEEHLSGLRLARMDYSPSFLRRAIARSALARYVYWNTAHLPQKIANKVRRLWRPAEGAVQYVGNTRASADSQRVADSRRAVDEFLAELPSRSGLDPYRILFVVDGMRPNLYDAEGLRTAAGSYFDQMREYLMASAARSGFQVIDMQPILIARHRRDGSRFEYEVDSHWNAIAHEEAAMAVAKSAVFVRTFASPTPIP
jgi:hypothetical protein